MSLREAAELVGQLREVRIAIAADDNSSTGAVA